MAPRLSSLPRLAQKDRLALTGLQPSSLHLPDHWGLTGRSDQTLLSRHQKGRSDPRDQMRQRDPTL